MSRREDLDEFYRLLADLRPCVGGCRLLGNCHGKSGWPERGVYLFFEQGEVREDGVLPESFGSEPTPYLKARRLLCGRAFADIEVVESAAEITVAPYFGYGSAKLSCKKPCSQTVFVNRGVRAEPLRRTFA